MCILAQIVYHDPPLLDQYVSSWLRVLLLVVVVVEIVLIVVAAAAVVT